jgi:hypothetical protein
MDSVLNVLGEHAISCADFSVRAEVSEKSMALDAPAIARIDLTAVGADDDGEVLLNANGRIALKVAQRSIDFVKKGIVLDAGDEGNIGLRAGTAPAIQHVELMGNGGSIILENGQLPMAPKIEITVDSIILSVGASKITIGPAGIQISSVSVSVEGKVEATLTGMMAAVKGQATAELSAAGEASVKGAIVMIN